MLIGGALFFAGLMFLARCLLAMGQVPLVRPFVRAMRAVLLVLFSGYLGAYVLDMIAASAHGDDAPPDWPDSTALIESVAKPLFYLLAVSALSFGGAAACFYASKKRPDPGIFFSLKVMGCFYMPMGLLAVAAYRDPRSLNPWFVLKAVILVAPRYLATWILALLAAWAVSSLPSLLEKRVPYAALRDALRAALTLYSLFVVARALGLLYRTSRRQLHWLEE